MDKIRMEIKVIKSWSLVFLICLIIVFDFFISCNEADAKDAGVVATENARIEKAYASLPLSFIRNDGQTDARVAFYETGLGHTTFFTKDGVYLSLNKGQSPQGIAGGVVDEFVRMSFVGAYEELGNAPEIDGEGLLRGRVNYFNSSSSAGWMTDIPTYEAVVYREVYDGIDLRFYGNNSQLEYDVIVSPGSEVAKVVFSYEGIKGLRVADKGDLEISLENGKIVQKRPYIYQEIDGERVEVDGRFRVFDNHADTGFTYGFRVASYDKARVLVIDPVLVYSTYLGGSYEDYVKEIAIDDVGNIYITGGTSSTEFPVKDHIKGEGGGGSTRDTDVFVTKMNADGTELIYSTYLGGSTFDYGATIDVDKLGNTYITGLTLSDDFPVKNPIQATIAGSDDIFVTKIDATGSRIVYSTYLGGGAGNGENTTGSALDDSGNIYITGRTWSTDFPMVNPIQGTNAGSADAFVTKINSEGTAIVYSTYLGGSDQDEGWGIAVDSSGNAYVSGRTLSFDFPIKRAMQRKYAGGLYDGFVTKINPEGTDVVYSTYLGGSGQDEVWSIAVDNAENVFVTGKTSSVDFPLKKPIQDGYAGGLHDGFVTKINSRGRRIVYSTYFGGSGDDGFGGIKLDTLGDLYFSGWTDSIDFPLVYPIQDTYGGGWNDAVAVKITADGSAIAFSTYLGGSDMDYANDIAVNELGDFYIVGNTKSIDFSVKNPIQDGLAGIMDVFIVKITDIP
jgi:hypothetical protein